MALDEERVRYPEDVLEMKPKSARAMSGHGEFRKPHQTDNIFAHRDHYPKHRLRDGERILAFTDAAVAIAITLLALPLMESAAHNWRYERKNEGGETHRRGLGEHVTSEVVYGAEAEEVDVYTSVDWFRDHKHDILLFVTSFAVIFVFWSTHERLFRHVHGMTRFLSLLNFCWLLGIAWMPVSMELNRAAFAVADDSLVFLQYFGTMLVLQTLSIFQTIEVIRNPQTWREGSLGPRWKHLVQNGVDFVFITIAMGFSATPVGYWGMDLLMLTYPVTDVICSKWPQLKRHVGETSKACPKMVPADEVVSSERTGGSW